MATDRDKLEIVVTARNQASAALKQVQGEVNNLAKTAAAPVKAAIGDVRPQARAMMEAALAAGTLGKQTRDLIKNTLEYAKAKEMAAKAGRGVAGASPAATVAAISKSLTDQGARGILQNALAYGHLSKSLRTLIQDTLAYTTIAGRQTAMFSRIGRGAPPRPPAPPMVPPSGPSGEEPVPGILARAKGMAAGVLASIHSLISTAAGGITATFTAATPAINILGMGILKLTGPLGMVVGLIGGIGSAFMHLASIGISVIQGIIQAVLKLAEAIVSVALDAIHKLAIGLTIVGGIATAALAAVLRIGLGWNEFSASMKLSLETMLHSRDAAEDLFEWMHKFAREIRVQPQGLMEAGKELVAYGMNAKYWLPLAADLAAGMKTPLKDTVDLLGRADSEMMLMRSLFTAGISKEKLISVGIQFKPGTMEPVNRAQLLGGLEQIIRRDFTDLAKRQAASLGGIWQGIKDRVDDAIGEITGMSYPKLIAAGDRLLANWDKLEKSPAWMHLKERLAGTLAVILDQVSRLIERAPQLAEWFAKMLSKAPIEQFLSAIVGLASWLRSTFAETISKVGEFIEARLGIAGETTGSIFKRIAIGIMNIVADVAAAMTATMDMLNSRWPEMLAWIKATASQVKSEIEAMLKPVLDILGLADKTKPARRPTEPHVAQTNGGAGVSPANVAQPPPAVIPPGFKSGYDPTLPISPLWRPPATPASAATITPRRPQVAEAGMMSGLLGGTGLLSNLIGRQIGEPIVRAVKGLGASVWRGLRYNVFGGKEGEAAARLTIRSAREGVRRAGRIPGQYKPEETQGLQQPYTIGWRGAKGIGTDWLQFYRQEHERLAQTISDLQFPEFDFSGIVQDGQDAAQGAYDALIGGMTGAVENAPQSFTSKVWGATSEMLKKAGVTPMWLESIGVRTKRLETPAAAAAARETTGALGLPKIRAYEPEGAAPGAVIPIGAPRREESPTSRQPSTPERGATEIQVPISTVVPTWWQRLTNVAQPPPAVNMERRALLPAESHLALQPAFAGAPAPAVTAPIYLAPTINSSVDVVALLRDPRARAELQRLIESTIADWLREIH